MNQNTNSRAGKQGGIQVLLPFFPEEITMITHYAGVKKECDIVYYFNGMMPISNITKATLTALGILSVSLSSTGISKQVDIVKCFGVSPISVK